MSGSLITISQNQRGITILGFYLVATCSILFIVTSDHTLDETIAWFVNPDMILLWVITTPYIILGSLKLVELLLGLANQLVTILSGYGRI